MDCPSLERLVLECLLAHPIQGFLATVMDDCFEDKMARAAQAGR
jgi:hypothetical protein